jgi:hypothetical protein|tara:strand:+ start:363 stop:674 length:312 start_codon:yes stop_codon:yes gene_type:complete
MPTFEISTTTYDEDISAIQVALTKIAAICNFEAGFKIAEPVSRFGWTFFQILIPQELYFAITDKFSDMIKKCKGDKANEKFVDFLIRYFDSRGCKVKIKLISD